MEIPDGPLFFTKMSDWDWEQIMFFLKEVTLNNKGGDLGRKKLWDYLKYFDEGMRKSYPFQEMFDNKDGVSKPEIETTIIFLHGVALEIHSSWCALAAVANFIIPRYDLKAGGTIVEYGYSVVIFLAKWADTIARNLKAPIPGTTESARVQFCPPFFTFTFAKRESLIDPSNCDDYITMVSTGKCINLPRQPLTTALNQKLVAARWNQVIAKFSPEDCPFPTKRDTLFTSPHEPNMIETYIGEAPGGPVRRKTFELFKQKLEGLVLNANGPSHVVPQRTYYMSGGCAELWGFLVMQSRVRPESRFESITIDAKWAHCTKLDGYKQTAVDCAKCPAEKWMFTRSVAHCKKGRNHTSLPTKPGCLNCLFLASAIQAKDGVIWEQHRGGISLVP